MESIKEIFHLNYNTHPIGDLLKTAIQNGCDLTELDRNSFTLVRGVNEKDLIEIYFLLTERNYSLPKYIVVDLIVKNYFDCLKHLLDSGEYDINVFYEYGQNALFYVLENDYTEK